MSYQPLKSTVKNILRPVYYFALPHIYQIKSLSGQGCLPDFLIVGVQKGGSTSLYNYLLQHPDVVTASRKEVHYFDRNYHRSIDWYKSHFTKASSAKKYNEKILTGECSPYYAYNPFIPERIAKLLPSAKIIFVLRNPTERAISHYKHNVNRGKYKQYLSLDEALNLEDDILQKEVDDLYHTQNGYSSNHEIYSIRDRGKYVDQIRRYQNHFPADNILVLSAEELFHSTDRVLNVLCEFLGLSPYTFSVGKIYNQNPLKIDTDNKNVEELRLFYQKYNLELESLLSRRFHW